MTTTVHHVEQYLNQGLASLRREDPEMFDLLNADHERQRTTLSLVASSGGVHSSALVAMGSTFVNVVAEGYPGARYHAGCEVADQVEQLAIDRAKRAFGARYANVQPHCASLANHTVMHSVLEPGDTMLGMALDQGGHLTHGAPFNLSGRLFTVHQYGLDDQGFIDYDQLSELAHTHRPRLIVCGTTSYTRVIDFDRIRAIADEVGAYVLADITHIAGLVAAGLHPNPINAAHFTNTCTFKQLYGPRGGLIMMGRDADHVPEGKTRSLSQQIQSSVFPLVQGSPDVHTIAGKAHSLGRLLEPEFVELAQRIRDNSNALAAALMDCGYEVVGNGTDNHIVLFRVPPWLNGVVAQDALETCGIMVNKNKIPGDERGASVASGVRLGSNTASWRHMGPAQMVEAVALIDDVLTNTKLTDGGGFELDAAVRDRVRASVHKLCADFPLPSDKA